MRSTLPKAVRELTQELTRLPGIGPKTAQRLSIHLLRQPSQIVSRLADTLKELHANVYTCAKCFNLSEKEVCAICSNSNRNTEILCIVEDALDIDAIEKTGSYQGIYHVIGGLLSPMEGIGPEELTLSDLLSRVSNNSIKEIIIALDQNMEGEATTRYIITHLKDTPVNITRLARGLPTGGDIEFADTMTLSAAFEGRKSLT